MSNAKTGIWINKIVIILKFSPKAKPSNRPYKVENIDWAKIIHKFKQHKYISRWNSQRKKSEMDTKSMIKDKK